jgi:hypothetical protein
MGPILGGKFKYPGWIFYSSFFIFFLITSSPSGGAAPGATGAVAPARQLHYNEYVLSFKVTDMKFLCN